jgi:hypothetical protein
MTADRATAATWRCAARVLGLPLPALRRMPRRALEALLRRARRKAEREWHRASLRIDALVAAQDATQEGRLP